MVFPFVFVQYSVSISDYYTTLVTSQSFGSRIISSARSYLLDQELASNLVSFAYLNPAYVYYRKAMSTFVDEGPQHKLQDFLFYSITISVIVDLIVSIVVVAARDSIKGEIRYFRASLHKA